MVNEVAKEYATALFELALKKKNINKIHEEFMEVKDILEDKTDLKKIITHPQISKEEKKEIIDNVFSKSVNKLFLNFFYVIIDNQRFEVLSDIFDSFEELYNEYNNHMVVTAYTTTELTDNELEELSGKLEVKYKRKVQLDNIIDKNVIGGVKLQIGDEIFDNTVRQKIDNLRKNLSLN